MSHETPQDHNSPEHDVDPNEQYLAEAEAMMSGNTAPEVTHPEVNVGEENPVETTYLADLDLPSKPTIEEPVKPSAPAATEFPRIVTPVIPPEPPVLDVNSDPAQFARDALAATGKTEATRFQDLKLENVEIPTPPAVTEPPAPPVPNRARVYDTPAPAAPAPQLLDVVLPPTNEDTAVHAAVTVPEAIPTPPPSDVDAKDVLPASGEETKKPPAAQQLGEKIGRTVAGKVLLPITSVAYGLNKDRPPAEIARGVKKVFTRLFKR